MPNVSLMWFRQDLRIQNNPALQAASRHERLLPIFINQDPALRPLGGAARWWLQQSLLSLKAGLQARGSQLFLLSGSPEIVLAELIQRFQIRAVYWNTCYEPTAYQRDQKLQAWLQANDISVQVTNGTLLMDPDEFHRQHGKVYKVYTPFAKQLSRHLSTQAPLRMPRHLPPPPCQRLGLALKAFSPHWSHPIAQNWEVGEQAAHKKLQNFIQGHLDHYAQERNFPALSATSHLSPHLRFGEISAHTVLQHVPSTHTFTSELLWREFAYHTLFHFPQLAHRPLKPAFAHFPWRRNSRALKAWQQGQTGYPLVDAGMRQLYATGWMHNRVRMVVGSFLVKDLFIPWQQGEAWFWDTLVDADSANNAFNWQWIGGCGWDAAPFFRIFNPSTQAKTYDPKGEYIQHWVPELRGLPLQVIHEPWRSSVPHYPKPIVDHQKSRELALAYFKSLPRA